MSEKSEVADLLIETVRRDLVDAVQAALTIDEGLIPDHDKYEAYLEDMVPSTSGFKVDKEKLQRFRNVLYFILATTFGVDGSDGKSQPNVESHLTNRQDSPGQWHIDLPYLHKIRETDQLAWAEILRKANSKVSSAMRELEGVHRYVESEMRRRGGQTQRLRRSKGCTNEECRRGLVLIPFKKKKAYTESYSRFQKDHLRNESHPDGGHKELCKICQTKERQDELDAEDAELYA